MKTSSNETAKSKEIIIKKLEIRMHVMRLLLLGITPQEAYWAMRIYRNLSYTENYVNKVDDMKLEQVRTSHNENITDKKQRNKGIK